MLTVAIVGTGRVGGIRARVIRRSGNSVLAAVVDPDVARARHLAREMETLAASDWKPIVAQPEIDAIVVSTPTKYHSEIAVAALRAGKHVLCEKPLGRSVDEAQEMFGAAQASGRILKTGFNYRHMAHVRKARQLLDEGALGKLYFLRCRYGHGGRPGYEQEWCTDADLSGGGVLLEQGIHIFDLVRHLLGEPSQALAQIDCFHWNFPVVEDNGFCLLQTANQQVAQIHVSWTQWVNTFELEIFGREGYLRLEGRDGHYGPQRLIWGKRQANHSRPPEERLEFSAPDDSWEREWHEFETAIKESREPQGSGRDGLRAQQLIAAAYESAAQRSWTLVPECESQPQEAQR